MAIELFSNRIKNNSDIDFIVELAYDSFKRPHGYKDLYDCELLFMQLFEDYSTGLVTAYEDNSPVGFAIYCSASLKEREIFQNVLFSKGLKYKENNKNVGMIAVPKKHRKKGIGASLLERVVEDCKSKDISQLFATCWKAKKGESYYLFKKLGFEELITLENRYLDNSLGTLVIKDL